MKQPDESEVTEENYDELGKKYTKGWKIGDMVKVLYAAHHSRDHGGPAWIRGSMDDYVREVYTIDDMRENHVYLERWWFPWYVLENVSRGPVEPDGETKAINDLKAKMDMLTKNKIIV